MDCGPTCLKMVAQHYGKQLPIEHIRKLCDKGKTGVSLLGLSKAAESLGFSALPLKLDLKTFTEEATLPCLVHWQGQHFVVVYKIDKKHIYLADPGIGKVKLSHREFMEHWRYNDDEGVALLLRPTAQFEQQKEQEKPSSNGLVQLWHYLRRHQRFAKQLLIGAFVSSLLALMLPFLTQSLVDYGIGNKDLGFIYIIVIAQLILFLSRTAADFIKGWVLAYMGAHINVAVLSDFLLKLMRLPLSFFATRNLGDIMQRINDHQKIEEFLTSHSINVVFSMLNLLVFSLVMLSYSFAAFITFLVGSVLSIFWITLFFNRRKILDYRQFSQMSDNQNSIMQLVNGMPEIKLNDCAVRKRSGWEHIQAKLFKTRLNVLALEQYQQAGNLFFNEGKNLLITFIAAYQVLQGDMTLGMMMATIYILGQMNAPIENLIQFMRHAQDAKLGMERLNEVQSMPDEGVLKDIDTVSHFSGGDITIKNLSFKYGKYDKRPVLDDLSLTIPHNKTTAIVGPSGSGKTTLLKLLLKFYDEYEGQLTLNGQSLSYLDPQQWRNKCGVVMQDGFIFNDTIANNIALDSQMPDFDRLVQAAKTANIHEEFERLPQGYHTKIGLEGMDLSGGQKQRLLIARAVYRNPEFIFFDEATSALDANNERIIQRNLQYFFNNRTCVIIAHRLSTVKNADNILVMEQGKVVESGDHQALIEQKGSYYHLVKNQLELGS